MKNFDQQILATIHQIRVELLDVEDLYLPEATTDLKIGDLKRPTYSKRVAIPSLIKILIRSLIEFGFVGGVIINRKNNHIIDGWHRVQVWKQLGNNTIPCFILDIDNQQEKKLHLFLNRQTAQFKPSDFGFTTEFSGLDLINDFGFTKADFIKDEDLEISENQINSSAKYGSRLITALPAEYYQKLEALKKLMPAPNKSQVLIKLIDFYETANS